MAPASNQIVGLVRFSYISKGGFAHSHDPQETQEQMIYAPDRMERRFKLFEDFALRSLKYQTDQDFTCLFLITQSFPKDYRERLEALVEGWPQFVIAPKPFMPQFRAIKACYEAAMDGTSDFFTSFRLDDDDMLDQDYIARLRRVAAPAAQVKGDGKPVVIGFNKGLYLEIDEAGNRIFDACERTPLSVGTAMVTPMRSGKNVYSRNHRKLPAFFTTYSDVDTPSWLRTIHRDNDSEPEFTGIMNSHDDAEIDVQLARHFDTDRAKLMGFAP